MPATVEITDAANGKLTDLSARSGQSPARLVGEAVTALHRSLVGDDTSRLGIPFKKRWSENEADAVLREVDPTEFCLEEPFRFEQRGEADVVVPRGDVTDLASVPTVLTWLVPRYGRHTLPALLHDHLMEPGIDPNRRERADTTFRDAMGDTNVPFVRRWVMWAAVSLATNLQRSWIWKLLVGLWVVAYTASGFDLFFAIVRWWRIPWISSIPAPVLLVSPLVLSVVWLARYRFGLISAYALLVLPIPLVAVGLTLLVYDGAEAVATAALFVLQRSGRPVQINPVRVSKLPTPRNRARAEARKAR